MWFITNSPACYEKSRLATACLAAQLEASSAVKIRPSPLNTTRHSLDASKASNTACRIALRSAILNVGLSKMLPRRGVTLRFLSGWLPQWSWGVRAGDRLGLSSATRPLGLFAFPVESNQLLARRLWGQNSLVSDCLPCGGASLRMKEYSTSKNENQLPNAHFSHFSA